MKSTELCIPYRPKATRVRNINKSAGATVDAVDRSDCRKPHTSVKVRHGVTVLSVSE